MIKLNLRFKNDPTMENFAPPDENGLADYAIDIPSDENGLAEYALDNDMIEYQRRVYNNWECGSESQE
jgi:hypothetical protein